MAKIKVFVGGMLQTNCYVVSSEKSDKCVIIDAGGKFDAMFDYCTTNGLTPVACLCTHGHFDHVCQAYKWKEKGAEIYLHKADEKLFSEEEETIPGFKVKYPHILPDRFVSDGETIAFSDMFFSAIHTPGHTEGSVCYVLNDDAIFTGDTIFYHSYGRTDLGGGDFGKIIQSVNRVLHREGDALLYPGHGETTTLQEERLFNPLYQE